MIRIKENYGSEASALVPGETSRHNHENCPAGEDTKRRLYLTRPDNSPNTVLGYCHNCGESGVLTSTGDYLDHWTPTNPARRDLKRKWAVPTGMTAEIEHWPEPAKQWARDKRLNSANITVWGIKYEPYSHSIYLPILKDNIDVELLGYQLRPLNKYGAKYVTHLKDGVSEISTYLGNSTNFPIVLVEDLASAIHIYNAGYSALVNYGTQVKPTVLHEYFSSSKNVVWFDNDNPTVRTHAEQAMNVWSLLHPKVKATRVRTAVEPKELVTSQIRDIVNGC